jgi:spectinomycin phosphotransferase
MQTPPDISNDAIIACLRDSFGLRVAHVDLLPLGADVNSAVYRVTADDGAPYFLKLRSGDIDEVSVAVAAFLHAQGVERVMAPIATTAHRLWARAHGFDWRLYPFFDGRDGFEVGLSKAQWIALGQSMRAVHSTRLPAELAELVPLEAYSPALRNIVRAYQQQVEHEHFGDPTAARFAAFWQTKRGEIRALVERAEQLAQALQGRDLELVVCHSDLHGGNVLLGPGDALAIVDWDEPILAPKERDLMFIGGGIGAIWNDEQEVAWFYQGYGQTEVDLAALAYYRNERIVADLAAYGDQIFGQQGSIEDREEGLRQVIGQFLPNGVVEIAEVMLACRQKNRQSADPPLERS